MRMLCQYGFSRLVCLEAREVFVAFRELLHLLCILCQSLVRHDGLHKQQLIWSHAEQLDDGLPELVFNVFWK